MALTYAYADKYLGSKITESIEDRATADIAALGDFSASAYWIEQLIVVQAYCIACAEFMAEPEDLYAAKLKHYQSLLKEHLTKAREAVAETGTTVSAGTITLERR